MKLYDAMKQAKLSDRQLAEMTDYSPVMIQSVRLGRKIPSVELALKIVNALAAELTVPPMTLAVEFFPDVLVPLMTKFTELEREQEGADA